jgi:hypothetical protein
MRLPTRLTRILQIGLTAYFVAFAAVGAILLVPPIKIALSTGHQLRATILISSWLVWILLIALLTYGSLKRWLWAFWVYLLLLIGVVLFSVSGSQTTGIALFSDVITGLIAAALLIASLVGLARFGPWAMKKGDAEGPGMARPG